MTPLQRPIRIAQYRLWLNRWMACASWTMTIAATVFATAALVQRLWELPLPLVGTAVGLVAAALVGSMVWTAIGRENTLRAAVRLDEAAGLRERLSSAHYCLDDRDPFAQAVVADAERVGSSLSVHRHIRLVVPASTVLTAASLVVAALMFAVPVGLLKSTEAASAVVQKNQLEQTQAVVKKKMDQVRESLRNTPVLEELTDQLDATEKESGSRLQRPADLRHEAVKSIDKLTDAVKQKREDSEYDSVRELRKMLRGLNPRDSADSPTQKLASALSQGDFQTAKEEVEKLRQQLASLKADADKETAAKLAEQLDKLAKQLEQLPKPEQIAQKLQQAGLKKEDVERILETLKKQDLEQVKKQLAEKGLSQDQIEKLAKQLQRRQNAGALAQKLAQAMQKGASAADPGQMNDAMSGLSLAAEQLSELEQLEIEMNQLDAALAELREGRNDLEKQCPT